MHLMDVWDASQVLSLMESSSLGISGGATFFLTSLLDDPSFRAELHVPMMRRISLGGSPIPIEVVRRAKDLGISITRAYGSTEHPSTTMSLHSDPEAKRCYTDGRLLPGSEVKIADDDGHPVSPGSAGEILSRGPELFVGYVDARLSEQAFDRGGWYRTGDIGTLDEEGYLTITDRKKDIIIRGGENISAQEVEEILQRLPGVAEVAVVAAPDARYGEHGCAMIRIQPGHEQFSLDEMRSGLARAGLARQKWPEELQFVNEFPRTASGKIQKNVLRLNLRNQD
jgi:acyl-CoA synthetase (AMP-forming)/AMP-acid ligase II